ncbi:MAG: hypothetical protein ABSG62_10770 [Terracidiphilus sp.]
MPPGWAYFTGCLERRAVDAVGRELILPGEIIFAFWGFAAKDERLLRDGYRVQVERNVLHSFCWQMDEKQECVRSRTYLAGVELGRNSLPVRRVLCHKQVQLYRRNMEVFEYLGQGNFDHFGSAIDT